MATITWPTTRAFMGATFSLGLDVSESTYTGFLTNNRQRRSNSADRLRAVLTLPPRRSRTEAGQIEALLMALRSAGDYLRMGVPHRMKPRGTLSGSPTVASNVLAGARSISLSGGAAFPNMLLNTESFGSSAWGGVGPATVTANTHLAPDGTMSADTLTDNSTTLNQTRSQAFTVPADGSRYVLSVYARKTSGGTQPTLAFTHSLSGGTAQANNVRFNTDLGTVLSGTGSVEDAGSFWRCSAVITNNGTNTTLTAAFAPAVAAYGLVTIDVTQTGSAVLWGAQLEAGAAATTYSGRPTLLAGDFISIGGNLLQVAYGGATADADGLMTVPLTTPVQRAITAGAAVDVNAPTGLWELDDDGLQLDYSAGNIMNGIAIPLRQVVA